MHTINLINGTFSKDEAKDVLTSLLSDKLKFHYTRQHRALEKGENSDSKQRIESLLQQKRELLLFLEGLPESSELKVSSVISLDLI